MLESKLQIPRTIKSKREINDLCIVKLHGAAGGKGYFLTSDQKGFDEGYNKLLNDNIVTDENSLYIQEYVRGVPVYLHFFYSPISGEIEFMGVDRRYESDIDGISRIPSKHQLNVPIEPTYNVVGNIPLVLRESLLEGVYEMGKNFVQASEKLVPLEFLDLFVWKESILRMQDSLLLNFLQELLLEQIYMFLDHNTLISYSKMA